MGTKDQKRVDLHESQVDNSRARKKDKAELRQFSFEFNRARWRVKIEGERRYLVGATLIFLTGLAMMILVTVYYLGGALYG